MATTKIYITSGFPPNDTADDGSTKVSVTSGFIPDDSGDTILPINVTGSCSFSGEVTRKVLYNRSVEGEI